jgi:CO/xanthine dehydrogenase FAD-binding subunit
MRYESPETVDEAVRLLAGAEAPARVLAGGTDLIAEMKTIAEEDGGYRIGAAVPCAAVGEHAGLKATWPGVVEAAELIGSTQIQGRATIVGNLCNASPAADTVPALIAAAAVASVVGPQGRRDIPVEEVAVGPGETSLAKGEFLTSVLLPGRAARSGDAYLRFIPRTEMDIAVVGAGVSLTLGGDGRCSAARVSLGAVAARALLVDAAARAIIATAVDEQALEKLAEAASAAAQPIDDKRGTKAFRTKVAGVLARRAATIALERARKGQ